MVNQNAGLTIGNGGASGVDNREYRGQFTGHFQSQRHDHLRSAISGAGALAAIRNRNADLTGSYTASGLVTINTGTLQVGNAGTTGSIAANVIGQWHTDFCSC